MSKTEVEILNFQVESLRLIKKQIDMMTVLWGENEDDETRNAYTLVIANLCKLIGKLGTRRTDLIDEMLGIEK